MNLGSSIQAFVRHNHQPLVALTYSSTPRKTDCCLH